MAFTDELSSLKQDLASADVSIADVLARAGVDRSTWTRWNNGASRPRFETWAAVRASAENMIAKRDGRPE